MAAFKNWPITLKIERVTDISVMLTRENLKQTSNFKSQNLGQFLRLGPDFLHVGLKLYKASVLFSSCPSKTPPSLIS